MPSPKQKKWYWREWGMVSRYCKASGITEPDRHDLHKRALGKDKSMLDLTNEEFDQVVAEFRAISDPDSMEFQLRQQNQPHARLMHIIACDLPAKLAAVLDHPEGRTAEEKLAAAESYILAILRQKYHSPNFLTLTDAQLRMLAIDISRAIQSKKKKHSENQPF